MAEPHSRWMTCLGCLGLLGLLVWGFYLTVEVLNEDWKLEKLTTDTTLENIEGALIQEARVSGDREQIVLVVQTRFGTTDDVIFTNTLPLYATMQSPETPE